jgi:hypothetical protein
VAGEAEAAADRHRGMAPGFDLGMQAFERRGDPAVNIGAIL